jgi:hypothetical protein
MRPASGSSARTPGSRFQHLAERQAELGDRLFKLSKLPSQLIPPGRLSALGGHTIRMPSRAV